MAKKSTSFQSEAKRVTTPQVGGPKYCLRHPKGFAILFEMPQDSGGGGWLCEAPTAELIKMCPEYNDKQRTDENSMASGLKSLRKSIVGHGLWQLPVINDTKMIDGNRRTMACHLEGKEMMVVLYRPWATASDFAEMNTERKPHSNVQRLMAWLIDPASVTFGMNRKFRKAQDVLGIDTLIFARDKRKDVLTCLTYARTAWRYCQPNIEEDVVATNKWVRKAVRMMVRFNDLYAFRTWMDNGKSAIELARRVKANVTVKAW